MIKFTPVNEHYCAYYDMFQNIQAVMIIYIKLTVLSTLHRSYQGNWITKERKLLFKNLILDILSLYSTLIHPFSLLTAPPI